MIGNTFTSPVKGSKGSKASELVLVDAAFAGIALMAYHWIGEDEFSSILTISAIFQCLALCLLVVHVFCNGSVHAISTKSLKLEGISLVCRLSTTAWVQGYVPTDHTGDWLYQCIDAVSCCLVLGLLFHLWQLRKAADKPEVDADSLPVMPFVIGSMVIGGLFHGRIMQYRIFDAIWMCGLYVGIVAVVPQLWLMTRHSGKTPALASHFIAVMAFSRVLSGSYMWVAAKEIRCKPWIEGFNHAAFVTLAGYGLHLAITLAAHAVHFSSNEVVTTPDCLDYV